MALTLADITNGNIYSDQLVTLAERIDFAWAVYIETYLDEETISPEKEAALQFYICIRYS